MKKVIYTVGLVLVALTTGQAQIKLLETADEMAGVALLGEDLVLITKKEEGGQYLYSARRGKPEAAQRALTLNAGQINAVIGGKLADGEVFVYHKSGHRDQKISVYTWQNGEFVKGEELPVPRMRNHSYNLGMFLTEDRRQLFITAELNGSQGYDDLYRSEWNGKAWTKPQNLGKQVNSKGVEFAPFVSGDSLFFSRQQGKTAYIYSAPMQGGRPGTAVQLQGAVNKQEAYNAYFRRSRHNTVWVSASKDDQPRYTAYLLGEMPVPLVEEPKPVAEEPVVQEEPMVAVAAIPVRAATPSLVLHNEFNRVHLSLEALAGLSRFLRQLPDGATLVVKGYSDGYGEPAAKQRVSAQRAQSVKNYIQRYFAVKGFKVEVESEVLPDKGKAHRKTELYLVQ